jgi:hypothetical protein
MPTKQEKASGRRMVDANVAEDETSLSSDVVVEPPTLLSLEERVDELEARLAAIEGLEPVRGEQNDLQNDLQIDRVAQQEARERRRLLRAKG